MTRFLTLALVALLAATGADAGNGKNSNKIKPNGTSPHTIHGPRLPTWDGTINGARGGAIVNPNMGLGPTTPRGCFGLCR